MQDQKYYAYVESIPGPTVERFQALAKELGMVMVLPIYEVENEGEYYNTAAVVDADGSLLGKYRKHHLPHLPQFWEKFYFRPGQRSATRCSRPRSAGSASTSATTGTSPRAGASSA